MNEIMKNALKKQLLDERLADDKSVDALVAMLESRASKLDRCGKSDCNHEHMIPMLVNQMRSKKQKVSGKRRIDLEKEELIRKGFKIKAVKESP